MAEIEQKSLLGGILPSIYFNKITIENSIGDILEERNPHIDHIREPDVVRNANTGKIERRKASFDLNKKGNEESLNVTINFVVKEKLNSRKLIPSWFGNQDILKFLNVKVVQSQDVQLTNLIVNKEILLSTMDEKKDARYQTRVLRLKDVIGNNTLNQYKKTTDNSGNIIYDISFVVDFKVKNGNPQHLSYFAISYIDMEQLVREFELDLGPSDRRFLNGHVSSQLVIDNYTISSETFVFLNTAGQIYTGPVHLDSSGQWRTGELENPQSEILDLKRIYNNKIQDFRNFKDIQKRQLDFSIVENELQRRINQTKLSQNFSNDINIEKGYFSNISLSRDTQGNIRYLFGIDFLSLAKHETSFGKLYREDNEQVLLNNLRIRNLTLKRIRISNDKELSRGRNTKLFDINEVPVVVVHSSESSPNQFVSRQDKNGTVREINISLMEEAAKGIRHFTGIDSSIGKETYGLYKYQVEIEIEDYTSNYIKGLIKNLVESKLLLDVYLNDAELSGNFDIRTNSFTQKFINEQAEKYQDDISASPWMISISKFVEIMSILFEDINVQNITNYLVSFVHPLTGTINGIMNVIGVIDNLITSLSRVISLITKGSSAFLSELQTSIEKRERSQAKIIKNVYTFTEIYDSDIPKKVGYDFLSLETLEEEKNTDGLKVVSRVEYEQRTTEETLKYFKSENEDINLKTNNKTYTIDDNILNSKYSFLTPSNVNLGDYIEPLTFLNKGQNLFDTDPNQLMVTNIARFKSLKRSPQISVFFPRVNQLSNLTYEKSLIEDNINATFIENNNITFVSREEKKQDNNITLDIEQSIDVMTDKTFFTKDVKEEEVSKDKNNIVQQTTSPISLSMQISENFIDSGLNGDFSLPKQEISNKQIVDTVDWYNLNEPRNALDIFSLNVQEVKAIPNQIKSLFLESVSYDKTNSNWFSMTTTDVVTGGDFVFDPLKRPDTKSVFQFNYNIIKDIEVLVAYGDNDNGQSQIKNPIWKRLDVEKFNNSIDKNLLCRMSSYEDKRLRIRCPKALELPVYNEYFIISPEERIIEPPKINITKQDISRDAIINSQQEISNIDIDPQYSTNLIPAIKIRPQEVQPIISPFAEQLVTSPFEAQTSFTSFVEQTTNFEQIPIQVIPQQNFTFTPNTFSNFIDNNSTQQTTTFTTEQVPSIFRPQTIFSGEEQINTTLENISVGLSENSPTWINTLTTCEEVSEIGQSGLKLENIFFEGTNKNTLTVEGFESNLPSLEVIDKELLGDFESTLSTNTKKINNQIFVGSKKISDLPKTEFNISDKALSIGKRLVVVENNLFGPIPKERNDDFVFVPDGFDIFDTFRIVGGGYWTFDNEKKNLIFLKNPKGAPYSIVDFDYVGKGILKPKDIERTLETPRTNLDELLDDVSGTKEIINGSFFGTQQWILIQANSPFYIVTNPYQTDIKVDSGISLTNITNFNGEELEKSIFGFNEELWTSTLEGGTAEVDSGIEKFNPIIKQGEDFFDHAFEINIPFSNKEIEKFNGISKPVVASVEPKYNFFIRQYEEVFPFINENMLPNLYVLLSEIVHKANSETFINFITLAESIELSSIPTMVKKDKSILNTKETFETLNGQYFDKFSRQYRIIHENKGRDTKFDRFMQVSNKLKHIGIPIENIDLIRDFNEKKELFPMYYDIQFATDVTTVFAESLKDSKLSTSFMNRIINDIDKNKVDKTTFFEVQEVLSVSKNDFGSSTIHKQYSINRDELRNWDITEILKAIKEKEQVDDNVQNNIIVQPQDVVGNIGIFLGKQTQDERILNNEGLEFYRNLLLVLFLGKLRKIIKEKFRTYQQMMNGKLCYSETIMYRVEKSLIIGQEQNGESIQNYYFPNSNEIDVLNFIDTQVKYNQKYKYTIFAYEAVIGTKYHYSDLTTKGNLAAFRVTQEPSIRLIEVPFYSHVCKLLDDPPIYPDVNIIPYKGIKDQIAFFFNSNSGDRIEDPIIIEEDDKKNINELRNSKGLEKDEPIRFKTDVHTGVFQIYRITQKPTKYEDFRGNLIAAVSADFSQESLQAATSAAFVDNIEPNIKYYYTFRIVDVHGNVSNPSPIYEIEMIENSGIIYPIIQIVDFEKDIGKLTKSARKFIQIKPAFPQTLINKQKSGFNNVLSARELKNIHLGIVDEDVWGKKFKIRLTSKKTGRKLDLNVTFDTKFVLGIDE